MNATAANVLTVEDDPIVRADLRLVLEGAGFSVCADARDGIEAVELAREHAPDVILLDLGLPYLDGVAAARQILAERDVPIVALTGRSRELAESAVEAGATSYVTKPFQVTEVVGALRDAIARHADSGLAARREESRRFLVEMMNLMGYSEEWADELERRSFAQGRVWRRVS
jgi:CheY-like chemotaxis protein